MQSGCDRASNICRLSNAKTLSFCSPHQSPWMMLSQENFTLGPSAEQNLDVSFTATSLLQGVYSTRICAYNQTETGAFLYFLYHTTHAVAKQLSSKLGCNMAQHQNIPAQLGPSNRQHIECTMDVYQQFKHHAAVL